MISISISSQTREHLAPHFHQELPGSKFYCQQPENLLEEAMRLFPEQFRQNRPEADGRRRLSLHFPHPIGISGVVAIDELTPEERSRIELANRQGQQVRCVATRRLFETTECQLVLSADWQLITMFPGELAPPLPARPDEPSAYWDRHVFIKWA